MGYTVQYGSFKYDKKVSSKKNIWLWGVLVLTIAVTILSVCFPNEISEVRNIAFPFLRQEVREAFGEMVTQIGEGVSVSEATTSFCREIVFENGH